MQISNLPIRLAQEGSEPQALCEQTRRLRHFAERTNIGGEERRHHSTEQHALCKQRRRLPYFANRPDIGGAQVSRHSTRTAGLREQERRLLYFANRPDIRDTELPHHRTRTAGFGYAATKVTVLREQTKHQWCGTPTPRHEDSRLCVSRDESYRTSRN